MQCVRRFKFVHAFKIAINLLIYSSLPILNHLLLFFLHCEILSKLLKIFQILLLNFKNYEKLTKIMKKKQYITLRHFANLRMVTKKKTIQKSSNLSFFHFISFHLLSQNYLKFLHFFLNESVGRKKLL